VLQGERVTLRAISRDDLPRLLAFNNDIEVELAGGGDPPLPKTAEWANNLYNRFLSSSEGPDTHFAIDVDGQFIGMCSLFNFDGNAHNCELGITIGDKSYWSQGYGREVVRLVTDYAFRYRNQQRVWLRVHGRNVRAQRAYAACGYAEEGRLRAHVYSDGDYDDLVYMGILRHEWQAAPK